MAENGVFIKFDPEKIMVVAGNLNNQHKRLVKSTGSIQKKSKALMNSWQSDSASLYIEKLGELNQQGEKLAKTLLSFSQDLQSASGIYKIGESQAKQKAEVLPTEGVFLV